MKHKSLDKGKEARRRARKIEAKGLHQRVVVDKRRKAEKHKKPLEE